MDWLYLLRNMAQTFSDNEQTFSPPLPWENGGCQAHGLKSLFGLAIAIVAVVMILSHELGECFSLNSITYKSCLKPVLIFFKGF